MISLRNINWREFNLLEVIKGCAEDFLSDYKARPEAVQKVVHYRKSICDDCHMNSNNWCDNSGNKLIRNVDTNEMVIGCGCSLGCKQARLTQECPAGLWKAVNLG